jgi:hypothetical protein
MGVHPNQVILGAVQVGACAALDEANPYKPEDEQRYLGWEEGHKRVVEEYYQQQRYNNASLFRKFLCSVGLHNYRLKRIPGRPHIDAKTGNIDRRDPIIKKYTCGCCGDVYFVGLGN